MRPSEAWREKQVRIKIDEALASNDLEDIKDTMSYIYKMASRTIALLEEEDNLTKNTRDAVLVLKKIYKLALSYSSASSSKNYLKVRLEQIKDLL